jgi:membrane protein DedA with SNARE-associated domain
MQAMVEFLVRHGYLVVFLWVLVDQAGVPIPGIPMLIAAGALAGAGRLDLGLVVVLALIASLLADSAWFWLGRTKGTHVLGFLCRVSLEPESCVRRTTDSFARRGALTLVVSKFVPGLATAAPPLAGIIGMTWPRFLWLDTAGTVLWVAAFAVPGYLFSERLDEMAEGAALTGAWLFGAFVAVVVLFVLIKFVRRQLFLHRLRVARIAPEELLQLMDGDEPPFVVDLRHRSDFENDPRTVPGAFHFTVEEIEQHHELIPRDRDVVLYCT